MDIFKKNQICFKNKFYGYTKILWKGFGSINFLQQNNPKNVYYFFLFNSKIFFKS